MAGFRSCGFLVNLGAPSTFWELVQSSDCHGYPDAQARSEGVLMAYCFHDTLQKKKKKRVVEKTREIMRKVAEY